jgi:hypothetical protein
LVEETRKNYQPVVRLVEETRKNYQPVVRLVEETRKNYQPVVGSFFLVSSTNLTTGW